MQTEININEMEVWNVIRGSGLLVWWWTKDAMVDSGVDDVGQRWLTTVLTTSCELVPISCGVTGVFFGVRALIKSDT